MPPVVRDRREPADRRPFERRAGRHDRLASELQIQALARRGRRGGERRDEDESCRERRSHVAIL
jgi:hypothetical protein